MVTSTRFEVRWRNKPLSFDKQYLVRLYAIVESDDVYPCSAGGQEVTSFMSIGPKFELELLCASKLFYVVIQFSKNCNLLAVFDRWSKKVVINEQTTVAAVFNFASYITFFGPKIIISAEGYPKGGPSGMRLLRRTWKMKNNFICDNGQLSKVLTSNPNGLETNSLPMFNFLANIISHVCTDCALLELLFMLTTWTLSNPSSNHKPSDTEKLWCPNTVAEAMWMIARKPFNHVGEIYEAFAGLEAFYKPALNTIVVPPDQTPVPNQWTLTLKFNRTGAKNFIFGGPGYIDFDHKGRAWIANNVRQGTDHSATFGVVLRSNGRPAKFSPLTGGGLLGAGFGVSVDRQCKTAAFGNFGWGSTDNNPQDGSVSLFKTDGQVLSPPNGNTEGGFKRAQGIYYDCQGNLWITGWGSQTPLGPPSESTFDFESANSSITVYLGGDPQQAVSYQFDNPYFGTFDVVVDDEGRAYVSNAGSLEQNVNSSVYCFRLVPEEEEKKDDKKKDDRKKDDKKKGKKKKCSPGKKLKVEYVWNSDSVDALRQVVVAPGKCGQPDEVLVAAFLRNEVLRFDRQLNPLEPYDENLDGPWGLAFDGHYTLYVSNFRRIDSLPSSGGDAPGPFGLTVIFKQDDEQSRFLTLKTGGASVMLANGFPLYGSDGPPSFEPLMRLTGSAFDDQGNLWSMNNWKPSIITDITGNPGGDGVVVFIGIAGISL